jgi:hypothetical protein
MCLSRRTLVIDHSWGVQRPVLESEEAQRWEAPARAKPLRLYGTVEALSSGLKRRGRPDFEAGSRGRVLNFDGGRRYSIP